MADPVVELRNVTFGYGAVPVVEGINLHLHRGQFAGLVGPSGAGKTTVLRLILGSLTPNSGMVFIEGSDLKGKLSILVYATAIPLSFVERWLAVGLYVVVAVMWLIPDRRIEKVVVR